MARVARLPSAARSTFKWIAVAAAALLGLPLILSALVIGLGVTLSAAPWRDQIGAAASGSLGRSVRLDGPLELVPSLRPLLRVGGIHVGNPPGFTNPEFASLGQARLQLDLMALLRGQVLIYELSAENVSIRIEKNARGELNWHFDLLRSKRAPSGRVARSLRFDVNGVSLRNVAVEYYDAETRVSRYFDLEELSAEASSTQPLKASLKGALEKNFPYALTLSGGTVGQLAARASSWPFEVTFDFLGTVLRATGTVDPRSGATEVLFGVGTQDLSEIERLLQTTLPKVGASALAGRVTWRSGEVKLAGLRGTMGATSLDGDLTLDVSGAKPKLTGTLAVPTLDLRPFLTDQGPSGNEPPRSLADTYRELEGLTFNLRALQQMDVDLMLSVGQWLSLPGDVRDAQLAIRLEDGRLAAPVQGTIAGVPLRGELNADATAAVPEFRLQLGTRRTHLGGLAELLFGAQGMEGTLGRFDLRLAAAGESVGELTRALDVRMEVDDARLTYGNVEGGRPVKLDLAKFAVAIPSGERLTASARGALLDVPFTAQARGGDLVTSVRQMRSPVELVVKGAGATVRVEGMAAQPEARAGTDLKIQVDAARAGDLSRWLGVRPDADAPIEIRGRARVESDEWHLDDFRLRLGRSSINGELQRTGIGGSPLIGVRLDAPRIDLQELERMLPERRARPASQGERAMIDIPVLPQGMDLYDSDVQVDIERIAMRLADVTGVSFSGRIREGKMWPSPFRATLAETLFQGAVSVDLRGDIPEASVWVAASDVDIGRLLRTLQIVQDLEAHADLLRVELVGRGSRVGEMLERSAFQANLEDGSLTLRDPTGRGKAKIGVKLGIGGAQPGQPVSLDLNGAFEATPVTIRITSGALPDFLKTRSRVPFALQAQAAGAKLDLDGHVALPISQRTVDLRMTIGGNRLDSLSALARAELPPWGPWSLGGRFSVSRSGYQVPDLTVRVGASSLNGHGTLDTSGARPRLDVNLSAPRIQLDDFQLKGWSPFEKTEKKTDQRMSVEEMRARAKETAAQGQKLLSPAVLRRLDAYVDVEVVQVLSGQDKLGNGTLHAQLQNGRLDFGPAQVNVPGGSARLALGYTPSDKGVEVDAKIDVERFDYGILARRIKPGTDLEGLFSLRMHVQSRAPTLDALMQHADGRVDVAVWPRNLKAGVFDLWAVNLFLALVPAVDPEAQSRVNCAVGRFDLQDGKLRQDAILLDTSRVRVSGTASVDFTTENLNVRLKPRPKKPQFFSLATPVEVNGTLTDFKIGVRGSDVLDTTARLLSSLVTVPLQLLTEGRLPREGGDVCGANALREMAAR